MQTTTTQWDNSCIHCNQVITNPVCPHCLEKSIVDWLSQNKPALRNNIKNIKKEFITGIEETNCILCGRLMNLCSYCYTAEVFDLLKEKAPELIEEFVAFFNFDLLHEGYIKETELYVT